MSITEKNIIEENNKILGKNDNYVLNSMKKIGITLEQMDIYLQRIYNEN